MIGRAREHYDDLDACGLAVWLELCDGRNKSLLFAVEERD